MMFRQAREDLDPQVKQNQEGRLVWLEQALYACSYVRVRLSDTAMLEVG
jgi:hypothetical protein